MVNAPFPENIRCLISGPSDCGRTFLLKYLFMARIHFDKLYVIGPTGDQYNNLEYKDIVFNKDIKQLPHPDKLPKNIKKLMVFDDVIAKDPIINEYFCRARHENCDMIYLKQNIFSTDRQNVREKFNLFVFFELTGRAIYSIYYDHFTGSQLSYNNFSVICEKEWSEPYNYIAIDESISRYGCAKLRINWD